MPDPAGALAEARRLVTAEINDVVSRRERGEAVWPVVEFSDLLDGSVPLGSRQAISRRGCVVVKGTFPRSQAEDWDSQLRSYLEDNDFDHKYRYLDDGVFAALAASRPSIFPVYWSTPQITARQHDNMVLTRRFLNSFWRHESEGRTWFDPSRDCAYPDRVRRRPPGSTSSGLSPHIDSGSVERWLVPAYQKVFRHVFAGHPSHYDPWDAAYRPEVDEFESTVMCSSFRSFQGWTALSGMEPTEGVLQTIPIPAAITYILLRALQDDMPPERLCGAMNGQSLPVTDEWFPDLLDALVPIPAVEPGDTVWWHCDLIHGVAPVAAQQGWGNVMYIPVTPYCDKNVRYARSCGHAFLSGASPSDFAPEDYETGWMGRATLEDLNAVGREQLGLA